MDPKLLYADPGTDPFHSGGCSGHESGKPGGMSVPAEVVQSVSEVQIHGAAGYGGSPGAGRQSGDPGGQFPFCHDPAHHDLFDVVEEADDYYFPPVTGTYLRLTRFLIALLTYFVTPTYLLLMNHRMWIPENLEFIILKEDPNVPLILQFLLLELAIDGLRLAAVNTPNMLSTPLSVMAALVLGEFFGGEWVVLQ